MKLLSLAGLAAAGLLAIMPVTEAESSSMAFLAEIEYTATQCEGATSPELCNAVGDTLTLGLAGTIDVANPFIPQTLTEANVSTLRWFLKGPEEFGYISFTNFDTLEFAFTPALDFGEVGGLELTDFDMVHPFGFGAGTMNIGVETLSIVSSGMTDVFTRSDAPVFALTNAVPTVGTVPVPAGILLILSGVAGVGLIARRI